MLRDRLIRRFQIKGRWMYLKRKKRKKAEERETRRREDEKRRRRRQTEKMKRVRWRGQMAESSRRSSLLKRRILSDPRRVDASRIGATWDREMVF